MQELTNKYISEQELENDVSSKAIGGANVVDYAVHATAGAFLGGVSGTVIGAAVGGAAGKEKGVKKGMEIGAPVGAVVGGLGLAAVAKAIR